MRLVGQLSLVGAAMKSTARNAALAPGKGAGSPWRRWGATRLSLAGGFCPARGFAESATTRARPIPNFPPLRVSLEGNIASGEATSSPRIPSSSEMCRAHWGKPELSVHTIASIQPGKSTLLGILGSKFRLQIVPEPVSRWQNVTR